MTLTTREQLEHSVAELHSLINAKTPDPARLDTVSRDVERLTIAVKGQRTVDELAGRVPTSPFAGMTDSGTPSIASKAGALGAPQFEFSKDALEALQKGALDRRTVNTKDAITVTDAPMSGVGQYVMDVFPFLRDRARVLDLIPTVTTENPTVFYFRGTVAASAADSVAAGANKPYSEPHWEQVSTPVEKIAHYTRVNDEVVADFRDFLDVIGREMLTGLIDAENDQLLNGSGTTPDLEGLLQNADIQTTGSAGTDLDAVATAANLVRVNAFVEPDTVVMNPLDWASTGFLLAKDSTGQYLVGNPLNGTKPTLWGMTVVLTSRIAENTCMVANLKEAARVYVRQPPTLEVQPGGGSAEFIANQTLIRAEERLALAIVRPKAICTVTAI